MYTKVLRENPYKIVQQPAAQLLLRTPPSEAVLQ